MLKSPCPWWSSNRIANGTSPLSIIGAAAQQVEVPGQAAPAVALPGTNYVVAPATFAGPGADRPLKDLQTAIADWLAFEFGLPKVSAQAKIVFASETRMADLRFRDVPSDLGPNDKPDLLAVYDDDARTIYLPDGWTGGTAADRSVLVHEMVHHLQNGGGLKFACPEEREKTAYEAQERWLQLFGSSLEADFQIDPFTVLARTTCLY
ncbi:DUF6647 family protein [Mesorhizobium sp. LjNodule214]|uniref:DUF6647 family protein n=1 Tax=Mesorhizobium sp. LjNodule214 TaxID=3342252 RepID=UPI003ECDD3DF